MYHVTLFVAFDCVPIAFVSFRQPLLWQITLFGVPTTSDPIVAIGSKVKGCECELLNHSVRITNGRTSWNRPESGSILRRGYVGKEACEFFAIIVETFKSLLKLFQWYNILNRRKSGWRKGRFYRCRIRSASVVLDNTRRYSSPPRCHHNNCHDYHCDHHHQNCASQKIQTLLFGVLFQYLLFWYNIQGVDDVQFRVRCRYDVGLRYLQARQESRIVRNLFFFRRSRLQSRRNTYDNTPCIEPIWVVYGIWLLRRLVICIHGSNYRWRYAPVFEMTHLPLCKISLFSW